ncbi:MAG: hypothetical protein J5630_01525 [Bacteroidaceae bacterium]|nr:hypothetical protein [Bacteroidaceae bacterium]
MKRVIRYINMATLALAGVIAIGCSNDDGDLAPVPDTANKVTLTTTINLGGDDQTRALTPEGVKTFSEGDQIAVIYTNTDSERVKAVSNAIAEGDITNGGKSAKITVTLINPVVGSVDYVYPAVMARDDGTLNYSALCMQDGTLASLASNLDCAKGTGELTGSEDDFELITSGKMANQLAVCEFIIKNKSGSVITGRIIDLTLSDGTNTYTVSRAATEGPIYVAVIPVTSDKTIDFVATDGSVGYYKSVSGKTLAAGDMLPVNLTMMQGNVIDLSQLTADCTAQNGDIMINKLVGNYKVSVAAGATVTLIDASINYETMPVLSGDFSGITCLGDATIIIRGTNFVKGLSSGYPGIFVPEGSTLTITGYGTLYALGHEYGAGIGSGKSNIADVMSCGNIIIQGGTIFGTGGIGAAGIGSGAGADGNPSYCGDITIKSSVTHVYANPGSSAEPIGSGNHSTCGTVMIEDSDKVTQY